MYNDSMSSIRRAAQRSVASTNTPGELASRRREISTIQHPLKRAAMLAMHTVIAQRPECIADLFDLDLQPRSMRHIADGNQSSVYRVGDDRVLKINKPSIAMTARERQSQIFSDRAAHETMAEHIGGYVLPHVIFQGQHPILRSESAIQIAQPYEAGFDPELFTEASPKLNQERFENMRAKYPDAISQLSDFAEKSLALYDDQRLLPDTNGVRNLIINTPGDIVLIDATPITTQHADVQDVIVRQIYNLGEALSA